MNFLWENDQKFQPEKLLENNLVPMTYRFSMKNGTLAGGLIPDFGTLVLGWEYIHPVYRPELLEALKGEGPLFKAPLEWTWAHVAKFFRVMPSISQARKAGWDGTPDDGFNYRYIKINKGESPGFARAKGEILVFKASDVWNREEGYDGT